MSDITQERERERERERIYINICEIQGSFEKFVTYKVKKNSGKGKKNPWSIFFRSHSQARPILLLLLAQVGLLVLLTQVTATKKYILVGKSIQVTKILPKFLDCFTNHYS